MARSSAAATDNHPQHPHQQHSVSTGGSGGGRFHGSGSSGGAGVSGGNESMLSVRGWGALVALSHAEEQLSLAFALSPSTGCSGGGGGGGGEGGDVEVSQRRWLREWTRLCCLGDLHGKVLHIIVIVNILYHIHDIYRLSSVLSHTCYQMLVLIAFYAHS